MSAADPKTEPTDGPLVAALGHSFGSLDLEAEALARVGARVIDANPLAADDPAWAGVQGVLLGTAERLDRMRLEALPACRVVVRYGIGVDNIDIAAARALGMEVCNTRDYCTEEVADHALAAALALARDLPAWDASVRRGAWRGGVQRRPARLSGRAFGVVGFGRIGRLVAEKAAAFWGRVLVYDPAAPCVGAPPIEAAKNLDALLATADTVSLHLPLAPETRGLIDAGRLGRMKSDAVLVNVSRGGLVDEAALLEALRAERLAGAALDTFETEPIGADDPTVQEPRLLLSPHIAWISTEAARDLRARASEEAARVLSGAGPTSPVYPEP